MYWQEKPFDYEIELSPVNKSFDEFTKREAEIYFE